MWSSASGWRGADRAWPCSRCPTRTVGMSTGSTGADYFILQWRGPHEGRYVDDELVSEERTDQLNWDNFFWCALVSAPSCMLTASGTTKADLHRTTRQRRTLLPLRPRSLPPRPLTHVNPSLLVLVEQWHSNSARDAPLWDRRHTLLVHSLESGSHPRLLSLSLPRSSSPFVPDSLRADLLAI